MSFPKKGKFFPAGSLGSSGGGAVDRPADAVFAAELAIVLRRNLGGTRAAIKTLVGWTGANERTVKNWTSGRYGPSGEHLIELLRHSDEVLEAVLRLAGRERILTAKKLVDARDKLIEIAALIAALDHTALDDRSPPR